MSDKLDIRVTAASERGFLAWEAGEIVAGFSTGAEVAMWLEHRLRRIERDKDGIGGGGADGPHDDGDQIARIAGSGGVDFPSVVRQAVARPTQRRGLFR